MTGLERTNLVELYRRLDGRSVAVGDGMHHRRQFEQLSYVPGPAEKEQILAGYKALLTEAQSLPTPDAVFELLNLHIQDYLQAQISAVDTTYRRPGRFIANFTRLIDSVGRQDSRPAKERLEILQRRFSGAEEVWAGVKPLLAQSKRDKLQEAKEATAVLARMVTQAKARIDKDFSDLSEAEWASLDKAYDQIGQRTSAWAQEIRTLIGKLPTDADMENINREPDVLGFRAILRDELGIDLDELLNWHEEEMGKTKAEVFEIASKLNIGAMPKPRHMADIFAILNEFEGPCDTPAEMFVRMRRYLDTAQAECRRYIRMPEEFVGIIPTPEQLKDNFPWGGYYGGCQRRRPLMGETILNVDNYRAITDGWIRMCAIHECYPGHHMQWVRAIVDPLPETVKIGAKGVPLLEGTAHRSERLFEHIFPEDPFYSLFVAYRRHHTATRIKADLWLRYFGRSPEDVVKLYMDEMAFDWPTARGQVKAQELMVGYFNCYYYGLKRLEDLEKSYGYDARTFTELLFSMPRVSLATFERFLALKTRDKERILNDFPSIYM